MRLFFALLLLVVLASCAKPPKVPVLSRDTISVREQTEKIGGDYVTYVRSGDTLYSIAFEAGLSPSDVAAWNGISQGGILHVGQKIRLTRPLNFQPVVAKKVAKKVAKNTKQNRQPVTVQSTVANTPKQTAVKTTKPTKSKPSSTPRVTRAIVWQWPTRGRVISSFSIARGNKGIDIGGKRGQAIYASAAGTVVYAGRGLRGYGNLLIIKHNEEFLSAYAHNDRILVKENQFVKQGEKISTMGLAKNGRPMLHFEVRLQGQPVNPVKYLPE